MKLRFTIALLTLVAVLTLGSSFQSRVNAEQPDPGKYSAAEHELVEFRNQMVPVRDDVKLAMDIFRPAGEGRFPVVLSLIPYNKDGGAERARWLAARGYAVVNVDVRGRYESEGKWDPFDPKHKSDGYDLVEWLAVQSWSTGKVGMWGLSYMGWTQWWTATQTPPSLVCIVPEVAPPDQFRNLPYQEGVLFGCMLDWAAANSGRTAISVGPGAYGGFSDTRFEDCMHTPYIDLNKRRKVEGAAWFETWIRENLSTAPYWQAIAYQTEENYAKVKVPSLAISGWFDADFPGTPMNYTAMKEYGGSPEARRPRIVIGRACLCDGLQPLARRTRLAIARHGVDQVLHPQRRPGQFVGWRRYSQHDSTRRGTAGPIYLRSAAPHPLGVYRSAHRRPCRHAVGIRRPGPIGLHHAANGAGRRGRGADYRQVVRGHLRQRHRLDGPFSRRSPRRLRSPALRRSDSCAMPRPRTSWCFQFDQAQPN